MKTVRAIRGATSLNTNEKAELFGAVKELLQEILNRNDLRPEEIISAIITGTKDITCGFPAEAFRVCGLADTPLIGAQEMDVESGLELCVRVMLHVMVEENKNISHIYLREAKRLRPDLD